MKVSLGVLFTSIVVAQFCSTSLWFAGNAALFVWQQPQWPSYAISYVTSAVQAGFIAGTLLFSLIALTDRFSPSRVFLACSLAGACANGIVLLDPGSFVLVLASRLLTGLSLAGIYPVGMKAASDWQESALGHWLGALVGALVLGTAIPHGLKLMPILAGPGYLILEVSILAVFGGLLMAFMVPDGPYRRKATKFSWHTFGAVFRIRSLRWPALGYFGHMWELYAFWTFVPWSINHYLVAHPEVSADRSLMAFLIIASGALGCYSGGLASSRIGSRRVAARALLASGSCCLISPAMWVAPPWLYFAFMLIWGFMVVADSPQFTALVASNAPAESRGTSITLVTCIGFAITIVSIHLLSTLESILDNYLFIVLAPGPIIGLYAMQPRFKTQL